MAEKDITVNANLTSNTSPALADRIPFIKDGTGLQDITPSNLLKILALLTEDTSPDTANDSILTYDNSASAVKRVLNWVHRTATQTLTNKTLDLGSNTLTGTKAQFNTAMSDADFATLTGTEVLTNKTIDYASNTIGLSMIPGGRLTLTSGTPVTTSDVLTSTSVYYTPYLHNLVPLWNGTYWVVVSFTEQTLALGTVTSGRPYDVFAYLSSGALAIESLIWTNDTTRATAVTLQDGRYCKSGDKTRLYLGTFYTISTTQTMDTTGARYLFNMYNRVPRSLFCKDTTDSWNYSTAAYQEARAQSTNGTSRYSVVIGIADTMTEMMHYHTASNSTGTARAVGIGIGINSQTVNSAIIYPSQNCTSTIAANLYASYRGYPAVGLSYYARLEYGAGADTQTWYGDAGGTILQTGMVGSIMA